MCGLLDISTIDQGVDCNGDGVWLDRRGGPSSSRNKFKRGLQITPTRFKPSPASPKRSDKMSERLVRRTNEGAPKVLTAKLCQGFYRSTPGALTLRVKKNPTDGLVKFEVARFTAKFYGPACRGDCWFPNHKTQRVSSNQCIERTGLSTQL